MVAIFAGALSLAGLCTAAYVLATGTHGARGTLAWVLALVLLPWVAVPLYWSSGQLRFHSYQKSRKETAAFLATVAQPTERPTATDTESRMTRQVLANFPDTTSNHDNAAEIFTTAGQAYEEMLTRIRAATDYILLQSYIFRSDSVGKEFADTLVQAAARGCTVVLIYDEVGSWDLSQEINESLQSAGVTVCGFSLRRRLLAKARINFRNHRKLLIVDGEVAFVGGMNIGQEYVDGGDQFERWRDTQLLIKGSAVQSLQRSFVIDWAFAAQSQRRDGAEDAARNILRWTPTTGPQGDLTITVCPTGPHDVNYTGDLLVTHLASSGKQKLWVATPYFVPDERVINAFILAAMRGVDVRIIVPRHADYRVIDWAHRSFIRFLHPFGIRFYYYAEGFTHQKVMLVDATHAAIGSMNIDNRSFRLNFEITCVVLDRSFCEEVERMLRNDLKKCDPIEPSELDSRLRHTILESTARMLAPVL
ncbi:MAG: cardiolipin synthase [Pseudomonadota bacterium]